MKSLIFNSFYKLLSVSFIILPTPVNISIWWNLGSMLGLCLLIQILSGLFLSMHFCPNTDLAFMSVVHITQDVSWGWLIRMLHVNGASLYFMCMYIHIGRGVYYHSFIKTGVWFVGVMIFMLSMATAFMGYVLPWGQMSFWGATVITNLVSAIPYMGGMIVEWIWGGFSINNATLNRFYSIHFLLPFIVLMMVGFHLIILHVYGSNNPLGLLSSNYMISFHLYYTYKDVVGFLILIIVLLFICLQYPFTFSDPDNFMPANSLVTPVHIQPEWYFLFAYSILRSIPSKLGGVLALLMSILILLFLSFLNKSGMLGLCNYPVGQAFFWGFVVCFFLLTWTGARPIEYPFFEISQFLAFFYFIYFLLTGYVNYIWDSIILG